MVKRWMCDPESTHQHPEGQYVDLIDFVYVETKIAALAAEVERLREALVPAMEWVRQNGIDGNIGMLDAFAAAEIIRELAAGLIGPAHNFQEICNAQNRPPSATEREHL